MSKKLVASKNNIYYMRTRYIPYVNTVHNSTTYVRLLIVRMIRASFVFLVIWAIYFYCGCYYSNGLYIKFLLFHPERFAYREINIHKKFVANKNFT